MKSQKRILQLSSEKYDELVSLIPAAYRFFDIEMLEQGIENVALGHLPIIFIREKINKNIFSVEPPSEKQGLDEE